MAVGHRAIPHSGRLVVGTHGYRAHEGGYRTIRSDQSRPRAAGRGQGLAPSRRLLVAPCQKIGFTLAQQV